MNRRIFLKTSCSAAIAAASFDLGSTGVGSAAGADETAATRKPARASLLRHRFGVNYVPSRNWFFFWNDFEAEAVARDLDAIASLSLDHIRMFLIWPYFQPSRTWVSPAHLERLNLLMTLAAERKLDVQVSMLNGWLSGFRALPFFDNPAKPAGFYAAPRMIEAQEPFFRETAAVVKKHPNFLGFDLGNEMECCWSTGKDTAVADAWCERFLNLAESLCPEQLHVNGTWGQWFFGPDTFSPKFMATRPECAILHCYPAFCGGLQYGGYFDPPSIQLPAATAALVRAYANDPAKPVWMQEYGASKAWIPESRIPEFLEKTTLAAINGGVCWFTWWASHNIDRKMEFDAPEYDFGLFTVDNKLKDCARKYKQMAEQYRGKPVTRRAVPSKALPPPSNQADTWKWLLNWIHQNPEPG